jgi:soluble lytic murein transglycosylase-like protein
MGAAARECGFKPEYLSELCDPAANIVFGTKHLYSWGFNYGKVTNLAEALTRWNGSNTYAHEVLAKFDVVRGVTRV